MHVFEEILKKIEAFETIVLARHISPDFDAYGSQGGLAEIIKANFPEKKVYCVGERERKFDYLFKPHEKLKTQNDYLLIVLDCANTPRIDNPTKNTPEFTIKIDHHPETDKYGDIQYVDTKASSTCEIIFDLFLYATTLKGYETFKISTEAKRLLYCGIIGDTGKFSYGFSKKTFETASILTDNSFNVEDLYTKMYEMTPLELKFQATFIDQIEMVTPQFAIVKITKEKSKEINPAHLDVSRYLYLMANLRNVKVWVLMTEDEDGSQIRVNIRSKKIVINHVAETFGGGGHKHASGVRVKNWQEAEKIITSLVDELT